MSKYGKDAGKHGNNFDDEFAFYVSYGNKRRTRIILVTEDIKSEDLFFICIPVAEALKVISLCNFYDFW